MTRPPPRSTLFPYTTLFRSLYRRTISVPFTRPRPELGTYFAGPDYERSAKTEAGTIGRRHGGQIRSQFRSEEHTSELQSHHDLVCRLLLEKKKKKKHCKHSP